jgi:hypothetical protein
LAVTATQRVRSSGLTSDDTARRIWIVQWLPWTAVFAKRWSKADLARVDLNLDSETLTLSSLVRIASSAGHASITVTADIYPAAHQPRSAYAGDRLMATLRVPP